MIIGFNKPYENGYACQLRLNYSAVEMRFRTNSTTWTAWKNISDADTLDGLHASSFIQTNQSAKVIVSTTAPSDTTAVWIVPN